jgi:hypothetical protein
MLAFELSSKHCAPCENGAAPLDEADVGYFLQQLDLEWEVVDGDPGHRK